MGYQLGDIVEIRDAQTGQWFRARVSRITTLGLCGDDARGVRHYALFDRVRCVTQHAHNDLFGAIPA